MSRTKGPSKAQQILAEAQERLRVAQLAVDSLHSQIQGAIAVRDAYHATYDDLKRALAPKPRGNGAGKSQSPAPNAKKKSSSARKLQVDPNPITEEEKANALYAADHAGGE